MNIIDIICSKENIYKSIYSVESYIFEKDLLIKKDKELLYRLSDKYNLNLIEDVIKDVQKKIKDILDNKEELFEVEVYFRAKGYKENDIEFRPIHTSSLINQISMVSILNILLYEFVIEEGNIIDCHLSSLSNLIPNNFYGNIPSEKEGELFKPWKHMYKKYSEDSSDIFSSAYNNSEFKYEVTLDIEKFFPSINPYLIYKFIIDKVGIQYDNDNLSVVKMAIYKLLHFKVTNIDIDNKNYYGVDTKSLRSGVFISKGVAQGLPQSYFFGNICMIDIAKVFTGKLEGKSLFYVDDSYIYTNKLEDEDIDFEKKLEEINNELLSCFKIDRASIDKDYRDYNEEIFSLHNKMHYVIKVHETSTKSQCCIIKDHINKSTLFLNSLTRQASMGSFEMNNVMEDIDDITLSNKFITIEKSIDSQIGKIELDLKELQSSTQDKNKERIYNNSIKKLVRLSKFFRFRTKLLEFRKTGDYNNIFNLIDDEIPKSPSQNKDLRKFIEFCNDNIFFQGLSILLKNELLFNPDKIEPLLGRIKKIDEAMLKKNSEKCGYITRIINEVYLIKDIKVTKYNSLDIIIESKIKSFRNIHLKERNKEIVNIINRVLIDNNISNILFGKEHNYISFIAYRTENINSQILNSIISKIMNVSLSDSLIINKIDNKIITISELRIINIIRNSNCNLNKKLQLILDIMGNYDDTKMDNTIYEVIEYFIEYVIDVDKIDNLILIHKYTSDMWKNGSKYLYFYTLHNQEHAIDLIKSSIRFIRSIDFIEVKLYDYYLIFLSCYLHDISMVKYPELGSFINLNNRETNLIYHDFKREIDGNNVEKKDLLSIYKKIDNYFEMLVRNNHAYDSSEIIRNSKDLDFLNSSTREFVSQISAAHGFDSKDIYKVKSNALNSLISKKYDKIILRFADLLDISGYRVSIPILNNNINNMSNTSVFHWISHHYISGYEIITRYYQSPGIEDNYLNPKSIVENIEFNIKVNAYQFTAIENEKCDRVCLESIKDSTLLLSVNKKCEMSKCNFMCKWLLKKNGYLYDELAELEVYLNNNKLNYYKSKITIKIEMDRGGRIKPEYVDKIVEYIK